MQDLVFHCFVQLVKRKVMLDSNMDFNLPWVALESFNITIWSSDLFWCVLKVFDVLYLINECTTTNSAFLVYLRIFSIFAGVLPCALVSSILTMFFTRSIISRLIRAFTFLSYKNITMSKCYIKHLYFNINLLCFLPLEVMGLIFVLLCWIIVLLISLSDVEKKWLLSLLQVIYFLIVLWQYDWEFTDVEGHTG